MIEVHAAVAYWSNQDEREWNVIVIRELLLDDEQTNWVNIDHDTISLFD